MSSRHASISLWRTLQFGRVALGMRDGPNLHRLLAIDIPGSPRLLAIVKMVFRCLLGELPLLQYGKI